MHINLHQAETLIPKSPIGKIQKKLGKPAREYSTFTNGKTKVTQRKKIHINKKKKVFERDKNTSKRATLSFVYGIWQAVIIIMRVVMIMTSLKKENLGTKQTERIKSYYRQDTLKLAVFGGGTTLLLFCILLCRRRKYYYVLLCVEQVSGKKKQKKLCPFCAHWDLQLHTSFMEHVPACHISAISQLCKCSRFVRPSHRFLHKFHGMKARQFCLERTQVKPARKVLLFFSEKITTNNFKDDTRKVGKKSWSFLFLFISTKL